MSQIIVKITEGEDIATSSPLLQQIVRAAGITWPQARMIGTQAVGSHQLILALTKTPATEIAGWLADGYPVTDPETGDTALMPLGLDWEILAVEGEKVDQSLILPFVLDTPISDEEGEVLSYEPVTDVTGKLQTWAGHKWKY